MPILYFTIDFFKTHIKRHYCVSSFFRHESHVIIMCKDRFVQDTYQKPLLCVTIDLFRTRIKCDYCMSRYICLRHVSKAIIVCHDLFKRSIKSHYCVLRSNCSRHVSNTIIVCHDLFTQDTYQKSLLCVTI